MALFIELHSISGHPLFINVAHIAYVEPSGNVSILYLSGLQLTSTESGSGTLARVFGQMERLTVKESYEIVKRKIDD